MENMHFYLYHKWTVHIKYATAILESIIQFDCFIREYPFIFHCFVRGGVFAPNTPPYIYYYMNARYKIISGYNVHCFLFSLLPIFFYYIIKNLRGQDKV